MNLLQKIMNVCGQQMAMSEVFCPYLACSFAAHVFNLHNQVANICGNGLKPRSVKLNVILVSPPGLSKNESLNKFADPSYGLFPILDGILDTYPDGNPANFSKISGEITGAGFVGTCRPDGEEVYGDAYLYKKGILVYYEVASLFSKAEHSQDLINHVLRVMGDNLIVKRLAHIDIYHNTYVTIWGGIQPARIVNIDNSGMDRRALFIFHEWTKEEIEIIKKYRVSDKTADEIKKLRKDVTECKSAILNFKNDVQGIKQIRWMFDRKQFADMPADIDLIEGLSIGYNLMVSDNITDTLDIVLHPELETMLKDMRVMKDRLKLYEGLIVAISSLQSEISTHNIFRNHLRRMGYTYAQTKDLLNKAYSLGFVNRIKRRGGYVWKVNNEIYA